MGYVIFRLDEDRVFSHNGWTLDIPVYGDAVIRYRTACDWWLDELALDAFRGSGSSREASRQLIDKSSALFIVIAEYLSRAQSDDIAEMIRADQRDQYESRRFDEGKEMAKFRAVSP